MRNLASVLLLMVFAVSGFAQPFNDPNFKKKFNKADALVYDEAFLEALPLLEDLYKYDTLNANLNHLLGICYLRGKKDHSKAIRLLESASRDVAAPDMYQEANWKERKAPGITYYYLGKAYHYKNRFDRAVTNYYNYRSFISLDDVATYNQVRQQIQYAENAMELIKNPVGVKVTNLGPEINTQYPEYCPVVSADGKVLIFTSRREGGTSKVLDDDGRHFEDIYVCRMQPNGKWSKPQSIGSNINSSGHEAAIGLSPDGQLLFIYKDDNNDGNIYQSQRTQDGWSNPEPLGSDINTSAWETHASVTATQDMLVFSSNRSEGGHGGRDLWYCKKLPTGDWGLAMNMGSVINTNFEEDSPFITADGKTLIFSSQGHTSMGGFDIFRSDFEDGAWMVPVNIGYPINTAEDDVFFVLNPDGKTAYYSSRMDGGFGDTDLYKLRLETRQADQLAVARGNMKVPAKAYADIDAKILVTDEGGAAVGTFRPNPSTGFYVLVLDPGETYTVSYEADGYDPIVSQLPVDNSESYVEYDGVLELDDVVFGENILALQEETKRLEQEQAEAAARAAEQEALAAEAAKKAKEEEEALALKRKQEEERIKAEELAAKEKEDAEAALAAEEAKARQAEIDRKKAEAQARFQAKQEAAKKAARKAAEAEALAKKEAEEEQQRQAEAEARAEAELAATQAKIEEAKKAAEAKKREQEELVQKKAEEEKAAQEAELAAAAEADRAAKEEEQRKAEEARKQQEAELAAKQARIEEAKKAAEEAALAAEKEAAEKNAAEEVAAQQQMADAKALSDAQAEREAAARQKQQELQERIKALKAQRQQQEKEIAEVKEVQVQKMDDVQKETSINTAAIEAKRKAMLARINELKKRKSEVEKKKVFDEAAVVEATEKEKQALTKKQELVKKSEQAKEEIEELRKELEEVEQQVAKADEEVQKAQTEVAKAEEVLAADIAEQKRIEEEERKKKEEAEAAARQIEELKEQERKRIEQERLAAEQFEKEQREEAERTKRELIQLEALAEQQAQVETALAAEERKKQMIEAAENDAYSQEEVLANATTLDQLRKLSEQLIKENLELKKQLVQLNAKLDLILQRLDYQPDLEKVDMPASSTMKNLQEGRRLILRNIFFDYNQATLRSRSKHELNKLYDFMKSNPGVSIEVSGHTDSRGNDDYNMRLSKDRAQAVVDYLVRNGISSRRLTAMGYGETRPIARNENSDLTDNPVGRQLNRRIEISLPKDAVDGVEVEEIDVPAGARIK